MALRPVARLANQTPSLSTIPPLQGTLLVVSLDAGSSRQELLYLFAQVGRRAGVCRALHKLGEGVAGASPPHVLSHPINWLFL